MNKFHHCIHQPIKKSVILLSMLFLFSLFGINLGSLNAQSATFNIKVFPLESNVKVLDMNDSVVEDITLADSLGSFRLAAGSYQLMVSQEGFRTFSESFQLQINETREMVIRLEKSPRSFFSKYKYWIIGGAAVITTGAILLINKDNSKNGPGIPIPPGRPGG